MAPKKKATPSAAATDVAEEEANAMEAEAAEVKANGASGTNGSGEAEAAEVKADGVSGTNGSSEAPAAAPPAAEAPSPTGGDREAAATAARNPEDRSRSPPPGRTTSGGGSGGGGSAQADGVGEDADGKPGEGANMPNKSKWGDSFKRRRKAEEDPDEKAKMDAEEAKMETEWAAAQLQREAEARAAMAARRHCPRLFKDSDGDEANEFWEEKPAAAGSAQTVLENVTKVTREVLRRK